MTQKRWGSSVKQRTTFKIIIIIPCSWFCIGGGDLFRMWNKDHQYFDDINFLFFPLFWTFFFSFLRCFFKLSWTCWLPKAKMANAMISRNGCDIWKNPNRWSLTFLGAMLWMKSVCSSWLSWTLDLSNKKIKMRRNSLYFHLNFAFNCKLFREITKENDLFCTFECFQNIVVIDFDFLF